MLAALRLAMEKGWGDLEARGECGVTAFLLTCLKGSTECMQLLADAGCDTAAKSKTGKTGLICAVSSRMPAALRLQALRRHETF